MLKIDGATCHAYSTFAMTEGCDDGNDVDEDSYSSDSSLSEVQEEEMRARPY